MKKFLSLILLAFSLNTSAQIGYQVAVIDQKTGEPKANTSVSIKIELSDNAGTVFCTTTQEAETNDFGIVSLQVGNSNTFSDLDWSKLPLWVNATVDGVNVGKTQILTVPVAEHANHYGILTPQKLAGTWGSYKTGGRTINQTFTFSPSGSFSLIVEVTGYDEHYTNSYSGIYSIKGDVIALKYNDNSSTVRTLNFFPEWNALIGDGDYYTRR